MDADDDGAKAQVDESADAADPVVVTPRRCMNNDQYSDHCSYPTRGDIGVSSAASAERPWIALDVETNGLEMLGMVIRTMQISSLDPDTNQAVGTLVRIEAPDGSVDMELLAGVLDLLGSLIDDGYTIWTYGDFDALALEAAERWAPSRFTGRALPSSKTARPRLRFANAAAFHHLAAPDVATRVGPLKSAIRQAFGLSSPLHAEDTIALPTDDADFVEYAMLDAVGLRGLLELWWHRLELWGDWDQDRLAAYIAREATIADVARAASERGLWLDVRRLDKSRRDAEAAVASTLLELHAVAPGLNPGSPRQIIDHLRADGVTVPLKRRRKSGDYTPSVDKKSLPKITHPIVGPLLAHRRARSALATVAGLEAAAGITLESDGHMPVRTRYRTLGCITSRWSSSQPNLQNIPKGSTTREVFLPYEDDEEPDPDDFGVREAVRPPRTMAFVQADLSQIEYRVAAALSGDEAMMAAYREGGAAFDFHRYAAQVLSAVDNPTKDQRQAAKGVGFGKLYGQSLATMAAEAEVTPETMQLRVSRYDAAFPQLKAWCDRMAAWSDATRWTKPNPYGRRFPVTAGYMAVNYLCQSTAREVFCDWLLRVAELGYRIVAMVHDEIVLEAPDELAEEVGRRMCELAAECTIPGAPEVPIAASSAWSVESWGAVYRDA